MVSTEAIWELSGLLFTVMSKILRFKLLKLVFWLFFMAKFIVFPSKCDLMVAPEEKSSNYQQNQTFSLQSIKEFLRNFHQI